MKSRYFSLLKTFKKLPVTSFLLYWVCALGISPASAKPTLIQDSSEPPKLTSPFGKNGDVYEFRKALPSLIAAKDSFYDRSVDSATATRLSLEDCIRLSFENNPGVQKTIADLRSSKDNLIATQREWNPTVTIQGNSLPKSTYRESFAGENRSSNKKAPKRKQESSTATISGEDSAALSATLNWKYLDFSRQPRINSRSSAYDAQEYVYISFSRNLIAQVQSEYFRLISLIDLVQSYTLIVDAQLENAKAIDAKFSAGRVSLLDVGQVYSQLYNSMTSLVSFINQYYETSSRLASLIALPDSENLITPTDDNKFYGRWKLDLPASIQSASNNNEKIKASLETAQVNRWEGIAQLNTALPSFNLGASAGWRSNNMRTSTYRTSCPNQICSPTTQSSLPWNSSSDISVYMGFTWTLYQGGINNANASASFNRSKSFEYQALDDKNLLISQVKTNFNSLDANIISFNSAEAAVYSSRTAYDAALARLRAGLTDITTVNQSIQAYQDAIRTRASSIRDYNIALAELYSAAAIWPANTENLAVGQLSSPQDQELTEVQDPELTEVK